MNKKIRVGILFGGQSAEHEVSLQSAKNIIKAIDKEKYEVVPIGIDKDGTWYTGNASNFLLNAGDSKLIALNKSDSKTHAVTLINYQQSRSLLDLKNHRSLGAIDVFFPALHGPMGEDGTIQGFLKLANVPFVGAGVLGSAVGMDKDVMKRLLRDAQIPTARFLTIYRGDPIRFDGLKRQFGLPMFVKPANLGSSIGIHKIDNKPRFDKALKDAFRYDHKVLVEEYIKGREIECSVLGNDHPIASVVGEIIPHHEFYSYKAKYLDESGATLKILADLPKQTTNKIRDLAIKVFKILNCEGMARVDFFIKEDDQVLVNEINTIPGFTKISMYPKLWEASGISYAELIDRLIQLAIERDERDKKLITSFSS